MTLKLFVVYDSKTGSYGPPFVRDFTANALREWEEVANNKVQRDNQVGKYPADFTLFECGEFDQTTGIFSMYEAKRNLGLASDYLKGAAPVEI